MNLRKVLTLVILSIFLLTPNLYTFDVEFPLIQSFVHYPYNGNELLARGKYLVSTDFLYSNIFMFDVPRNTFNDFELFSATFGLQYALSDKFNLEFFNRFAVMYGGFMDLFIMDFHELIGLKRGARENFPRNIVNYYYKDKFAYDKSTMISYPLIAGFLVNIFKSEKVSVNFRTSLGIPLFVKPGLVSDKPFLSTGLIFLIREGDLSLDLSGYVSFFKRPDWIGSEEIRTNLYMAHFRGMYKKIFAGLLFRSTPFISGDISNPAFQMYFGYRFSEYVEFTFVEEFPPMDTVPDFSFRLTVKFGN